MIEWTIISFIKGKPSAKFPKLSCQTIRTGVSSGQGLSIFSFNCQSLRAHAADMYDTITQNSKILLLSETWLNDDENLDIPNFDCVVKVKRHNVRGAGVAIYHNSTDTTSIVTPNMDTNLRQSNRLLVNVNEIGDLCAAQCLLENGQIILTVAIYISPNQKIERIIDFIHQVLLLYTVEGAALVEKDYDKIPMILSGDFNVNFASNDAQPLIEFLRSKFNLQINNDPSIPTTRSGTTLDAVFSRYLDPLKSIVYVSYFSYHKPIVSFINYEQMNTIE